MHLRHLRYLTLVFAILTAIGAWAYDAAYYAQSSALADGHWVKIAVDTTGVYEISTEQLREWGFEKPELVKVYGYGGLMADYQRFDSNIPDDIPPTPSVRTADGRLVFYAEGTVRSHNQEPIDLRSRHSAQRLCHQSILLPYRQGFEHSKHICCRHRPHRRSLHLALLHRPCRKRSQWIQRRHGFSWQSPCSGRKRQPYFSIRNLGRDKEQQPKVAYWVETAVNAPPRPH